MTKLKTEDCLALIEKGEFSSGVVNAAPKVAIVLTQSWCPQWTWMRAYLEAMPEEESRAFFWVEYDREEFFQELMTFKEETFRNAQIPYVRYYRDGKLVAQSNFIDERGFLRLLGTP